MFLNVDSRMFTNFFFLNVLTGGDGNKHSLDSDDEEEYQVSIVRIAAKLFLVSTSIVFNSFSC